MRLNEPDWKEGFPIGLEFLEPLKEERRLVVGDAQDGTLFLTGYKFEKYTERVLSSQNSQYTNNYVNETLPPQTESLLVPKLFRLNDLFCDHQIQHQ